MTLGLKLPGTCAQAWECAVVFCISLSIVRVGSQPGRVTTWQDAAGWPVKPRSSLREPDTASSTPGQGRKAGASTLWICYRSSLRDALSTSTGLRCTTSESCAQHDRVQRLAKGTPSGKYRLLSARGSGQCLTGREQRPVL